MPSRAGGSHDPGHNPTADQPATAAQARKLGRHGGRKKRTRRKSFAAPPDESHYDGPDIEPQASDAHQSISPSQGHEVGTVSIGSVTFHDDHRTRWHPQPLGPRRASAMPLLTPKQSFSGPSNRLHGGPPPSQGVVDTDIERQFVPWEDETFPLISAATLPRLSEPQLPRYGSHSSRPRDGAGSFSMAQPAFAINYPPSMPASPIVGPVTGIDMNLGDVMIWDLTRRAESRSSSRAGEHNDANIAGSDLCRSGAVGADAYFPALSEMADEEPGAQGVARNATYDSVSRRRSAKWPDLSILEEWNSYENHNEDQRAKRITEPQLVDGRLRPTRRGWYRTEEDAPYRFTYFNEEFPSTIHSQTLSELCQPGGSLQELFKPDPILLSDEEEEDDEPQPFSRSQRFQPNLDVGNGVGSRNSSVATNRTVTEPRRLGTKSSLQGNDKPSEPAPEISVSPGSASALKSPLPTGIPVTRATTLLKAPRYGDRPVWWLDVLCPTESEMKVISKAFGIHPLTAEDIMLQEAREKVELFRHYYFVNYRTFDQDVNSEDYLEPVNMYVVVFREGVLSFHFSMTPHAANVRRRIRQLKDYLILSSDWVSYAIIDDITDAFGPLIENIEDEVDEIDEAILRLHSPHEPDEKEARVSARGTRGEKHAASRPSASSGVSVSESGRYDSSGNMLRQVGECRKRVMSLYRLLGNKADVIKGFAKRCNERSEVAPRSEIGLYLGDIQDHIVTMTGNLAHYEKILARSHGNYLAQINIRMMARQEETNDVLGKLTVLSTIVLPLSFVTGLFGMNVWVPGQEYQHDITWFCSLTAGLLAIGVFCYLMARRVYKIV